MDNTPVISVITPSYNQGEFLEATLVSVLSQEGEFHLDYLVIDGGSSDDSPQIIRAWADRLEQGEWPVRCRGINFRWISERDRGQTDALIKGFNMAEGDILAWLNSDDLYQPGALQAAARFFQEHPEVALVYGDAYNCDSNGNLLGRFQVETFAPAKLAYLNYICQPASFFRSKAFKAVGGLDVTLHYGMDFDLFAKLEQNFTCAYLPKVLATFRLHDASKTMRNDVLYDNLDETLRLSLKYFHWAPINRVFGVCHAKCLLRLPQALTKVRPLLIGMTALLTLYRYLQLNRGPRRADLKLLTLENFKKLFMDRADILKGQQ